MITVRSSDAAAVDAAADVLVVGALAGGALAGGALAGDAPAGDGHLELLPAAGAVDAALDGGLAAYLIDVGFEAKPGSSVSLPGTAVAAKRVLVVGLGSREKLDADGLRRAAGSAVKAASKHTSIALALAEALGGDAFVTQAVAEGAILGSYRFDRYRTAENGAPKLESALVLGGDATGVDRGRVFATATCLARDLSNTPAADMTPVALADAAAALAGGALAVEVWDLDRIRAERLGGLIAVNQGADSPPRLVQLTYTPAGESRGTVALVGKGITFDSGGLSLKTADGMMTMKTDKSGAAAVIAAMSALAELGPDVTVVAIIPATENMPSGTAIRPGDVFTARNGKTVEVLNTDAEGRLILADGLSLAAEIEPDAIIDMATLTGACMIALGDKVAGLLSNDDTLATAVADAAERAGEPVWRLPLPSEYRKLLDSEVADMKNIGSRYGGALTAGLFLREFVGDVPWVHLDIAGPARAESDDALCPKGSTGYGVRTLLELIEAFQPPNGPPTPS